MKTWIGEYLSVKVLFSKAGIATQIWVHCPKGTVLVDAGDGVLRDVLSQGIDLKSIGGILITHGHFDHMGGLYSLLGFLRMVGRKEPLPVAAPAGCSEVLGVLEMFQRCYGDTIPFGIVCQEVAPREEFPLAGMIVTAYPMVHCGSIEGGGILDPIPAMGYRLWYNGETVAISGDTGDCPELRELVKGADLAILEATNKHRTDVSPEELTKVHISEDIAIEIAQLAKDYMLIHQGR